MPHRAEGLAERVDPAEARDEQAGQSDDTGLALRRGEGLGQGRDQLGRQEVSEVLGEPRVQLRDRLARVEVAVAGEREQQDREQ